jgi:toxin CptA
MSSSLLPKILLLVALSAARHWAGYTAGRFRSTRVSLQQVLKCFAGGVLMGWGGLLVPGHNDGLILIGMPLLWPYAWVAFLMMCLSIGVALLAERIASGPATQETAP